MKYASLYIIILLSFTSCITASYQRSNEAYGHAKKEFTPQFNCNTMVIEGQWAGEIDYRGGRCCRLQFDNVLNGDGRYLDVMIPLEVYTMKGYHGTWPCGPNESEDLPVHPGLPFFVESDRKVSGGHTAYLILRDPTGVDMELFYDFFNLKAGGTADPDGLMKKHFNYGISNAVYPLAVVKLEIQGQDQYREHDKFNAYAVIWNRTGDGKTVITSCSSVSDEFYSDHMDIRWKVRNKPLYVLRQAGYSGTVIADIVTSPVQLAWIILNAMGGGVR